MAEAPTCLGKGSEASESIWWVWGAEEPSTGPLARLPGCLRDFPDLRAWIGSNFPALCMSRQRVCKVNLFTDSPNSVKTLKLTASSSCWHFGKILKMFPGLDFLLQAVYPERKTGSGQWPGEMERPQRMLGSMRREKRETDYTQPGFLCLLLLLDI